MKTLSHRTIILIAFAFLLVGVLGRLLPHLPNATPLAAIAFAGSLYLGRRWALILPLAALMLSDLVLGLYDWRVMASVYGSFALVGGCAWLAARYTHLSVRSGLVLLGPVLFFLVTNAAVWAFSPWYAKDISGLLLSYELGLPFFRNMLLGDIAYTALLLAMCESVRVLLYVREVTWTPFASLKELRN